MKRTSIYIQQILSEIFIASQTGCNNGLRWDDYEIYSGNEISNNYFIMPH